MEIKIGRKILRINGLTDYPVFDEIEARLTKNDFTTDLT